MTCNGPKGKFVHLQQGKVLIVHIKCMDVNIDCTTPKASQYDTNTMRSILANIKRTHLTQGWP